MHCNKIMKKAQWLIFFKALQSGIYFVLIFFFSVAVLSNNCDLHSVFCMLFKINAKCTSAENADGKM